jgi:hypothetical protein
MSADADSTWATLEALAVRLLEHPKDLEPRDPIRRYGSLWRLWHFPPFAPQTTWTILTPGRKSPDGSPPLVREVSWDRARDNERVFSGDGNARPTVRLRDARLPDADLRRLVEEGARLAVPLVVFAKVVGVEQDLFGLENYEVSPFVRVQWWGEGPAEWRHFTDWVGAVREFVRCHLDEAG